MQYPRKGILASLAATLNQDIDDYRLALLADSGELPSWEKVWANQVEAQQGVRLSSEDKEAIRHYALVLVKHARGKNS